MNQDEPTTASHVILMRQPQVEPGGGDRPLSATGRAAALAAAQAMYGEGHHPGPLLASPTRAGRETAAIIAAAVHVPQADIYYSDNLQGATSDALETELRTLAAAFTLVTLVGHNPGLSELGRILARDPKVPDYQPAQWRYLPWPPPY